MTEFYTDPRSLPEDRDMWLHWHNANATDLGDGVPAVRTSNDNEELEETADALLYARKWTLLWFCIAAFMTVFWAMAVYGG